MLAHAFLISAGLAFVLPLAWMAVTSVKPLDQTMSMPPSWIPNATYATVGGERIIVVKEKKLKNDSLIVVPLGGHAIGKPQLILKSDLDANGLAQLKFTLAGREQPESERYAVEIKKECPAGYWYVTEWAPEFSSEREKSKTALRWDCVPESNLKAVPHAFWANYASALERMKGPDSSFFTYVGNTLWVCVLSVIGAVISCTLVAYAFAFLDFPGKNILFGLTLAVMMVPFPAVMVPLYDVFRTLGWISTYKPLWVPIWFGGAFFIFLLRQFFLGLPKDLLDAARIDGCNELEILWHVVVPLARPALAMVALFQFLSSWKDFMGPMLYLQTKHQFTLSLGLQAFQSQQGGTPFHYQMAASMLFSLPLVILFLLARKTFMRGIAMTGMKG
jgi:multiple sugar transport system permease protein